MQDEHGPQQTNMKHTLNLLASLRPTPPGSELMRRKGAVKLYGN